RTPRHGVGLLQFALGHVNRRCVLLLRERVLGVAFLERVFNATLHAAAAEGALARVVAPRELALAGLELDGARGAAEPADGATSAQRGIELDEAAEARRDFGPCGKEQGLIAAPQILPQHGENVHNQNLTKSADEMASTAKISVHCQ